MSDNKCVLNNCLKAVVVPKSAMRTSESLKNTLSAYFQGGHISWCQAHSDLRSDKSARKIWLFLDFPCTFATTNRIQAALWSLFAVDEQTLITMLFILAHYAPGALIGKTSFAEQEIDPERMFRKRTVADRRCSAYNTRVKVWHRSDQDLRVWLIVQPQNAAER